MAPVSSAPTCPHLSVMSIVNMNVGYFGIQYGFGLRQRDMSPIYRRRYAPHRGALTCGIAPGPRSEAEG